MTQLRPEQTADGWDAVAEGYAEHIDPAMAPHVEAALETLPVGDGDRVLDVACGSGALTLEAARRGADVVGVDFSKEQIRMLGERADREGLDVDARVMDGQDLAFDDDGFDAAFSILGLMVFEDRAAGFEELHRVLRPGGRALVTSWNEPLTNELFQLFFGSLKQGVPDAPEPEPPAFAELADPDRLGKEMAAAGFDDVEVRTVDRPLMFPDVETAWLALSEANPAFPELMADLGPEAGEAMREAFESICADRHGDGSLALSAPSHHAVGTKA